MGSARQRFWIMEQHLSIKLCWFSWSGPTLGGSNFIYSVFMYHLYILHMGQKRRDPKFLTLCRRDETKNVCTTVYLRLKHPHVVSGVKQCCMVAAPSQGCFYRHRTAANWTRLVLALGCRWGGRQNDHMCFSSTPPHANSGCSGQDKAAQLFRCVLQPRRTTETAKMMENMAFYLILQQSSCLLFLSSELWVNRNGF